MINNYLLVKASDAHAWVELYFKNRGWVRFEPTATASKNLDVAQATQNQLTQKNTIFEKINLNFMYVKYMIESWILDYNRLKQLAILNNLLNDTIYLLKFIASIAGVFLLSFLIYINIKSSTCKDELTCEMAKLLKILKKHDLVKKESETMQAFLIRAEEKAGISLSHVNETYHSLKYGRSNKEIDLKKLSSEVLKVIKKLSKNS